MTARLNTTVQVICGRALSPTQRKTLSDFVIASGREPDIVHLQQLQNLLDSAPGYGVRIQYLQIPMTIEEQLSWASESDSQTARALTANTRELLALKAAIERLNAGQKHILRTLGQDQVTNYPTPDLISVSSFTKSDSFSSVSAALDPGLVLLFHRLACFDLPTRVVGRLRTEAVWLGNMDGTRATHIQPPLATEVPARLTRLCEGWRTGYPGLSIRDKKLSTIVEFHAQFLLLHPFADGNGRVARAILMQQCLDLFGKADMALMNKGADYYAALKLADSANYQPLIELIKPVVA
jgi:Fic family protein